MVGTIIGAQALRPIYSKLPWSGVSKVPVRSIWREVPFQYDMFWSYWPGDLQRRRRRISSPLSRQAGHSGRGFRTCLSSSVWDADGLQYTNAIAVQEGPNPSQTSKGVGWPSGRSRITLPVSPATIGGKRATWGSGVQKKFSCSAFGAVRPNFFLPNFLFIFRFILPSFAVALNSYVKCCNSCHYLWLNTMLIWWWCYGPVIWPWFLYFSMLTLGC